LGAESISFHGVYQERPECQKVVTGMILAGSTESDVSRVYESLVEAGSNTLRASKSAAATISLRLHGK